MSFAATPESVLRDAVGCNGNCVHKYEQASSHRRRIVLRLVHVGELKIAWETDRVIGYEITEAGEDRLVTEFYAASEN